MIVILHTKTRTLKLDFATHLTPPSLTPWPDPQACGMAMPPKTDASHVSPGEAPDAGAFLRLLQPPWERPCIGGHAHTSAGSDTPRHCDHWTLYAACAVPSGRTAPVRRCGGEALCRQGPVEYRKPVATVEAWKTSTPVATSGVEIAFSSSGVSASFASQASCLRWEWRRATGSPARPPRPARPCPAPAGSRVEAAIPRTPEERAQHA